MGRFVWDVRKQTMIRRQFLRSITRAESGRQCSTTCQSLRIQRQVWYITRLLGTLPKWIWIIWSSTRRRHCLRLRKSTMKSTFCHRRRKMELWKNTLPWERNIRQRLYLRMRSKALFTAYRDCRKTLPLIKPAGSWNGRRELARQDKNLLCVILSRKMEQFPIAAETYTSMIPCMAFWQSV